MEPKQRQRIVERAITDKGIRTVRWATETAHPGTGGVASLGGDYMRLVLVLEGRRHVRLTRKNRPRRLVLTAGECLVVAPHCWLITLPAEPFSSIGVVLEARNPRFVLTRHAGENRRGEPVAAPAEVEIAPGLCDDVTMGIASALLMARVEEAPARLYSRRLAETLWLRLARHRSLAGHGMRAKSNVTYGAAEHFVRENFSRAIDRTQVARFLRISPGHVTRLFLQVAGETFGGFLLRTRLESARSLLRDPRLTVSEIAYLAGFTSVNYFVRAYRQRYRITPGRDRDARSEGTTLLPDP